MKNIFRLNFFTLIFLLFFTSFVFSEGLVYYTCHPMNSEPCDEPDLSAYDYSCEGVNLADIRSGIQTCKDLQRIGCINSNSTVDLGGGQFYLMNDIDCEGELFASFDFGDESKPTSTLDGGGFVIRNLRSDQGGIFDKVTNAVIKNLKLENLIITTPDSAGTLAKITDHTLIQNVELSGFSIKGGYYDARAAGGLVGIISNSFFDQIIVSNGDINVTIQDEIGGVLGSADRVKMNNIYINDVFIQSNYYHNPNEIGGVVGFIVASTLSNIRVGEGVSFGKMKFNIGGIVGQAQNSIINGAINLADILPLETQSTSDGVLSNVGGIIGDASGSTKITDSNNYGNIGNDDNGYKISGIVGYGVGLIHLENVFNHGNIFGKNTISGTGNLGNCFSITNVQNINGLVISTNKDYQKCEDSRVLNAWAWYCNYLEIICPDVDSIDCVNLGYNNYCLVGYGGWLTKKIDVNWVISTPIDNQGSPAGFSCCDNTGPVMCDSFYSSSNASFCQAQCAGVYFGTKSPTSTSENPYQSHPKGSIITSTTVDINTAAKCESYCDPSETLIFIGGVLPFCADIYESWDYQSGCVNGDYICENPCNYLNDTDCSIPLNQCGDGVCDVDENYLNCPQDCTFECVVQGGVCDLNSDCCSNNCQGGFCGSEIFECVVQGEVCDLNSDCCSNNCQGGFCGSEIIPSYNCIGSIDSNALIVEGDDLDLIENVNKVLIESVSSNTPGKCEYYCRPGFEKGSGVDENKCLLIYGYYSGCYESNLAEGWLIYPGDDNDLTILDNITPILSESDTSKKCEYYCDSSLGLVMRNGSCVPQFATEGICGDANRIYYLNEEFPGWGELCKAGSALPNSGFNLGNVEGDFVKWLCTARDVNANCRATRSEANIFDVNAILNFSVNNINGKIVGSVSCSKETKADLILVDEKGNNIEFSPKIVNCSYSPNSFEINPSIDLNEGVFYSIRASIKENSLDCSICSKTVLFTPRKVKDEKIPDNSNLGLIIILLSVIFIFSKNKRD